MASTSRPIVREQGSVLVVHGRVEGGRVARILLACTPPFAAAAAAGAVLSRDDGLFALAGGGAFMLLVFAAVFALSDRRTRFDLAARRARGPSIDLPFEELAAVQVAPRVTTVTPIGTDGTDFSEQRWRVTVLDRRAMEARHVYRRVGEQVRRGPGDPPLTPEQKDALRPQLHAAWDALEAGTHVVAEHGEPLPALEAGRHIARRLGLPFMDARGLPEERPPALVDAPLVERLRARPLELGTPRRPDGIEEREEAGRLVLRWRTRRLVLFSRANELAVDGERCLWRGAREESMPLSELDAIDVLSFRRTGLALFGRERWFLVPMPEEAAEWARARVIAFLQRVSEAGRSPESASRT